MLPEPSWIDGPPEPNPHKYSGTCPTCKTKHYNGEHEGFEQEPCVNFNDEAPCKNLVCECCPECDECHQRACPDCIVYTRTAGTLCSGCFGEHLSNLNEKAKEAHAALIKEMQRQPAKVA